ncbi:hypothetical protein HSX11_28470 [Oxalobacteraceae bacterium]|nr:hypothetical protein [Oxalobacteraceae bacterium]
MLTRYACRRSIPGALIYEKISRGLALSVLLSTVLPTHAQDADLVAAKEAIKKRDYTAAAKLLQPLLDKDDPKAMAMMSKMRLSGQSVIKDEGIAVELFKKGGAPYYQFVFDCRASQSRMASFTRVCHPRPLALSASRTS